MGIAGVTIVEFLRARYNEDEATATAAAGDRPRWETDVAPDGTYYISPGRDSDDIGSAELREPAEHIVRHDPARVLREVAANRALVDAFERLLESRARHRAAKAEWEADYERDQQGETVVGLIDVRLRGLAREADYLDAMEPVLRELVHARAAVYADHPDYDPSWRVE